jgi:outer membrane protein
MNTFKHHFSIGIAFMGLLAVAPLHAREAHIGFVKPAWILKEAASAKAAEVKLKNEFSPRQKEISDREIAFKAEVSRFDTESPTLTEVQRSARKKQLEDQDRALQLMRRNFQDDLNARKNDELQLLITRTNKVIKQIAETEKYDFIFQDAVYVNPKYDMTDKVIKTLDAQIGK